MWKKILLIILSVILIVALGFCIYWISTNWNKIKNNVDSNNLYTAEDLENAKLDGYNSALKDKEDLENTINEYRNTIGELNDSILNFKSSINEKDEQISNLNLSLTRAESLRDEYKSQLDNLQGNYEELLDNYNAQIEKLTRYENQINQLNIEKNELQANLTNAQNRINELNQTIVGYDNFINGLIAENQVVVKFYYKNSLYSVMVLQKGEKATISNPADTTYSKFLGWYLNDELIDLSTYVINENTTFVAGVNDFYDVKFLVDNDEIDSQIIVDNSYAIAPASPTKDGYQFDGWTVDNVVYDVSTYKITKNTTFVAKFTKIHNVDFVLNGDIVKTQNVRNNEYINDFIPTVDEYTQFNYWTVNGIRVNVANYVITSDTIFVANITKKYDVTFEYEESILSSQIVLENDFAEFVEPSSNDYKVFKGWSVDGTTLVDISNYAIIEDTKFIAVIDYYYLATFKVNNSIHNTQKLLVDSYIEEPMIPSVVGYDFDGWTIDGVNIVDVNNMKITSDIVFTAKLTKLYTVQYEHNGEIVKSINVRANDTLDNYLVEDTDRIVFLGWTINGSSIVDLTNYVVNSDVKFISKIEIRHLVEFKVGSEIIESKYVNNNTTTTITENLYDDFEIYSWKINDEIVEVESIVITEDILFEANFERIYVTMTFTSNSAYDVKTTTSGSDSWTTYYYTIDHLDEMDTSRSGYWTVNGTITVNGITEDYNATWLQNPTTINGLEFGVSGKSPLIITVYNGVTNWSITVRMSYHFGISGL